MFTFFLVLTIILGLLALGFFFWATYEESFGLGVTCAIFVLLGIVSLVILVMGRTYWVGQGSAPEFAQEWSQKWRPGSTFECQPYDSDSNGYISCTVGWKKPDGSTEVEAIECGIDRWYAGWKNEGCRLMKGFSGSQ